MGSGTLVDALSAITMARINQASNTSFLVPKRSHLVLHKLHKYTQEAVLILGSLQLPAKRGPYKC